MVRASLIKPNLRVLCSKQGQFGIVDRLEGTAWIKLNRDTRGQHHYIPLSWVTKVDDAVHVDRSGEQAMREWTTTPSAEAAANMPPKP